MRRAGDASAFWGAAFSRFGALTMVVLIVVAGKHLSAASLKSMDATRLGIGIAAGMLDITGTMCYIRAIQTGRMDAAVMLTSLYPAITVTLARIFLREHFTRWKLVGMLAALVAVPLIATG
jgi:uncharacterized membrane protein